MKKIIVIALFLSGLWADEVYQACALDKKEAKAALASQIVSTIKTGMSIDERVSTGFIDIVSKEAKRTIQTSSRLTLSNVHYKTVKGEVCASISKQQLIALGKGKLKSIKHFSLEKLPSDELKAVQFLESRLGDIRETQAIVKLFSDDFEPNALELIEKRLTAFEVKRSELFAQSVNFVLSQKDSVVTVDGIKQDKAFSIYLKAGTHNYTLSHKDYGRMQGTFELKPLETKTITIDMSEYKLPFITISVKTKVHMTVDDKPFVANQATPVEPGEHTYRMTAKGYCPLTGSFQARLGSDQTISVDISGNTFPQLTVSSNQAKARLLLDGKDWPLGKTKTFNTCSNKEVTYQVRFDGQTQTQKVSLEPGLIKTEAMDFLTKLDKKKLKAIAASYESKSRWVVRAQLETITPFYAYGLDLMDHHKWLRLGWGIDAGFRKSGHNLNAHYTAAMQFTGFGNEDMPLHLGNVAVLVPYLGVQGAIGFQATPVVGIDLKSVLGVDIVFTKFLALELYYHQSYLLRKEAGFGIALSLVSPFSK